MEFGHGGVLIFRRAIPAGIDMAGEPSAVGARHGEHGPCASSAAAISTSAASTPAFIMWPCAEGTRAIHRPIHTAARIHAILPFAHATPAPLVQHLHFPPGRSQVHTDM